MRPGSLVGAVVAILSIGGCGGTQDPDANGLLGEATWYGEVHHGRPTASGEPFDMYAFTAAHKTLPFQTVVRVTRDDTRQSVVVRINDRGPYGEGRVIDLSRAAAEEIDLIRPGHVPVTIEILELPATNSRSGR
jgi:rare lipoprotein A